MARNYPRWLMRLISKPPKFFYRIGLGPLLGRKVLLLKTKGRKSGLLRTTPLQYEQIGDAYYLGSMLGARADWYQNIVADPHVHLRIGRKTIPGLAEPINDPNQVYEFIKYRLAKNPRMIGTILRMDGISASPGEEELRDYSQDLTIVAIKPTSEQN
jgi:deazaflavin-dependent oxidoreductase (nitroreductase family)